MTRNEGARSALCGPAFEQFLEGMLTVSRVPGVCIALSFNGERHYLAAGSRAVDDAESIPLETHFEIGCLIKTLVAAVAHELSARGELDLYAPISRYLPELADDPKGNRIAVWHLMCHTGGYAGIGFIDAHTANWTWETLVDYLRNAPQIFEPGTVFSYDQSAAALVGAIVTRVAERSYLELVEEVILKPLAVPGSGAQEHLRASGHAPSPNARQYVRGPNGQAFSDIWRPAISDRTLSVEALTSLAELLMGGVPPLSADARAAISARTTSRLAERAVKVPEVIGGMHSHCLPIGYGLGLPEFRRGVHGQDGTGKGQVVGLRFSRRAGLALAMGINAHAAPVRRTIISAVLGELGLAAAPERRSGPIGIALGELAGRYVGFRGAEVCVTLQQRDISISSRVGGVTLSPIAGTIDPDQRLVLDQRQPIAGVGFFRDPCSGDPCLMLGVNAFRKASGQCRPRET